MNRMKQVALGVAGAAMMAWSANATTLQELNLSSMVSQSENVIVGEAVSQRTTNANGSLYTVTTFDVTETLIGADKSEVEVAVPGGIFEVNGRRFAENWPGAPRLLVGQRAVLFLNEGAGDMMGIVGFSQGVLNVVETADGDAVMLPGASKAMMLDDAMTAIKSARSSDDGMRELGE